MTTDRLAKKPTAQQTLKHELERIMPAMAAVLPKHVTPERLVKIVLLATQKNQDLLKCSTQSIAQCLMQGAELGLELGGALGQAYLVPYKTKDGSYTAQFIIGYRGLIQLARNSGSLESIAAHVVYRSDPFKVNLAEEEVIHDLDLSATDRKDGDIVAAYAIARFFPPPGRDKGAKQIEVMTRAQIDAIRNRSRAGNFGPWVTDYAEMARKTVVRRLCKYLPLSPEIVRALEADSEPLEAAGRVGLPAGLLRSEDETEPVEVVNEVTGEVTEASAE